MRALKLSHVFRRYGVLSCGLFVFLAMSISSARGADEAATGALQYNEQIRPILAENCFNCHGPDSAARKASLRVDKREAAIEHGALVPGDPDASELLRRIESDDPEEQMPPPATKKALTAEQKAILRQWIKEGAEYQAHWSLIAPVRPEPPQVQNESWVSNPIDRFILARLEKEGLTPAAPADRRTLVRRLHLDLTGLPPAPELVESFVQDQSPDAYENLVDRVLESVHWGEHRARYWLDAARYADTHGIHFDNFREMWAYRDWLIKAFNQNMPFDQFTIEQLAGDLLPNATLDQKIASGFNRCNITTNEGGVIPEEYLVHYTRDRTEAVGQVWMGMTVGCAVCHEHKFDSLPQKEFYEMAAFFNNTTQGAMDGNIKDTPPVIPVPMEADRPRLAALESEIPQAEQALAARREEAKEPFQAWLASAPEASLAASIPVDQLTLQASLAEGQGRTLRMVIDGATQEVPMAESATWQSGPARQSALQPQGSVCQLNSVGDFERDQPWTCAVWIKAPANDANGAIAARMDNGADYRGWDFWLQARRIGTHIVSQWPNNALKVVGREQIPADTWTHVTVSYDGSGKAAGVKVYYNGQLQQTNVEADQLSDSTRTMVPFQIGQRHGSDPLSATALHDLRIYRRALDPSEISSLACTSQIAGILAKKPETRSESENEELYAWWLSVLDDEYRSREAAVASLQREKADIHARGTIAHVMNEAASTPMAFVLFRGEYDQRRDQVQPKTPSALPPMPDALPRNRLGFAQWLLLPEHPLTARVTVNQFWQQLFGTGLVRTSGDFGVAGEMPSHPDLLDWMAVDFRESGWDIKRFFKMVVMSSTYQQAAIASPEKLERDPDNRMLSRGPRFRMDAEMVRDNALAASGLLVRQIGGPSVKPYQPPGVWEAVAMIGSNTRDYREDEGDKLYRRSMYTFWKRSAPPASMEIFNAPAREMCTVRRERTNTPLQALVTLNDPQFVEAARALGQQVLSNKEATDEQRVGILMRQVVSRPPTELELDILLASLDDLRTHYATHTADAEQLMTVGKLAKPADQDVPTLAAWTMVANQILNLDEVLNK